MVAVLRPKRRLHRLELVEALRRAVAGGAVGRVGHVLLQVLDLPGQHVAVDVLHRVAKSASTVMPCGLTSAKPPSTTILVCSPPA